MRKFSRKQISAVGLAVMMSAQGSVMAAEVSQEETTVAAEIQAEKSESVLPEKSEESEESVEESVGEITETVSEESIEQSILESVPETETESNAELEEAVESEETTEELAEETTEESTEAAYEVENSEIAPLAALADGWHKDADGHYKYAKNGYFYASRIEKIDGTYYGFNANGIMYAGEEFQLLNNYYRAREDGSLYVSQWYQNEWGKWYYYDENGKGIRNGIAEINGKKYFFSAGVLYVNTVVYDFKNNVQYLANLSGELIETKGWHKQDGEWYYVKEDGTLYNSDNDGILYDNGYMYIMQPSMNVNKDFCYIPDTDIACSIDGSGHASLLEDGFHDGGGYYICYIEDGKLALNLGWKYIDGKWYYIGVDGFVGAKHFGEVDGIRYYFTSDGSIATNGWGCSYSGEWYYAYPSGALATGDTSINGVLYHFDEKGILKTGVVEASEGYDVYNTDGTFLGSIKNEGWNLVNGSYYYMKDGDILKNCEYQTEDGALYSFDSDGEMRSGVQYEGRWYSESGWAYTGWTYQNEKWYYADPETKKLCTGFQKINGGEYYFDESTCEMIVGEIVVDGTVMIASANGVIETIASKGCWKKVAGKWYYSDPETAKLCRGFQNIGGALYYFDETTCEMLVGEAVIDGKIVRADENGIATVTEIAANGWSHYCGNYYYYQDGEPYTGWVGDFYIEKGCMQRSRFITDKDGNEYELGEDGACLKDTWANDGYYYAKADGTFAKNEWITTSDGKTYYFDGIYKVRGIQTIDGKEYLFDEDGAYICEESKLNYGWNWINSGYYYRTENGIANGRQRINGKEYQFDHGKMLLNELSSLDLYNCANDFYYGEDGEKAAYTGWKLMNGNWYYFDERSQYMKGWAVINGNRYYFLTGYNYNIQMEDDQAGIMCTGYRVIDRKLYYFDKDGGCCGVCGPKNGWYDVNGTRYYMIEGKVASGMLNINGVDYAFARDGKMYANEIVSTDIINKICYANADGSIVTTRGWHLTSYGYIFVQQGGALCTGIHTIDGVTYMFGSDGILMY